MSKENTFELAKASRWAELICRELRPFCSKIEIAGSIRRGVPQVHDIDLVILTDRQAAVNARLSRNAVEANAEGPRMTSVTLANGLQVDVYYADLFQQDFFRPDNCTTNWGSILLCRTGPKEYNVRLAQQARQRGLRWVLSQGIFNGDHVVASNTEEDIFRALGLAYRPPKKRI